MLKNIKGVGDRGDIKEVSNGHASNYLFPNKLAELATEKAVIKVERERLNKVRKEKKDLLDTEKLAERIDGKEIAIKAKMNDSGKLYASIGPSDIVKYLKKDNIKIENSNVRMDPIKEIGNYDVVICLNHGLEAIVRVVIE